MLVELIVAAAAATPVSVAAITVAALRYVRLSEERELEEARRIEDEETYDARTAAADAAREKAAEHAAAEAKAAEKKQEQEALAEEARLSNLLVVTALKASLLECPICEANPDDWDTYEVILDNERDDLDDDQCGPSLPKTVYLKGEIFHLQVCGNCRNEWLVRQLSTSPSPSPIRKESSLAAAEIEDAWIRQKRSL